MYRRRAGAEKPGHPMTPRVRWDLARFESRLDELSTWSSDRSGSNHSSDSGVF
eukprot:jgi/Antlo1/1114/2253